MKKILLILVVLIAAGGAYAWYARRGNDVEVPLRTAAVQRDDLVATISATGTVEPEELIDVGAQVAGRIIKFGLDTNGRTIDYGSEVVQGQVLAEIDQSLYLTEMSQAKAQLAEANAGVKRAEADLVQKKAALAQAERDWQRAQNLGTSEALAQVSYDAYKAAYESAAAAVTVSEASILQAKASVDQALGVVERADRNLGYTIIRAPVDGVVIDRRVNIGQTVVSSLNAPSLFLIAKDLKRMQVWVAVNEADVGSIRAGQPVSFTADAFPGETFKGEVNKVRLNAQMTQNVVTYTVEVNTDNSSLRILPYLTANVNFEVSRSDNVLMVPNPALRWNPKPELIAPDARPAQNGNGAATTASASSGPGSGGGPGASGGPPGGGSGVRRRGPGGRETAAPGTEQRVGTVWVKDDKYVRPVQVLVGMTDGTNTEVRGDGLKEGLEVVTGEILTMTAGGPQTTNPFGPPRMGGRGGGGGGGQRGGGGGGGGGPRGGGGRGG